MKALKPHIYCIITICFFSTIEVAGKLIGADISAYAITAWRFFIGGLLLLPFALSDLAGKNSKFKPRDWLDFTLAGMLNVCLSMLFLQLSITYGKANLSAVIISSNPLFVTIFAALFLREQISKLHWGGLTIGLLGLMLIIFAERAAMHNSANLGLSVLFGLGAATTFALSTVYSKHLIEKHGNMVTLCFVFLSGSIVLFLYSLLMGKNLMFDLTVRNVVMMSYLSIGITGIAYILYFLAIKEIGAARASQYFFLKPAIATTLAWFIYSETLQLSQILGIVLIILSLSREWVIKAITLSKPLGKPA